MLTPTTTYYKYVWESELLPTYRARQTKYIKDTFALLFKPFATKKYGSHVFLGEKAVGDFLAVYF